MSPAISVNFSQLKREIAQKDFFLMQEKKKMRKIFILLSDLSKMLETTSNDCKTLQTTFSSQYIQEFYRVLRERVRTDSLLLSRIEAEHQEGSCFSTAHRSSRFG
jgi:hypothetical protein